MSGYLLLAGAIASEVFATTMMKVANGFTQIVPTVLCIVGYVLCFFMIGKAMTSVNLSIAYATWAGMGVVLTTIIAATVFGEHLNWEIVLGTALIIGGVVLVNFFSNAQ